MSMNQPILQPTPAAHPGRLPRQVPRPACAVHSAPRSPLTALLTAVWIVGLIGRFPAPCLAQAADKQAGALEVEHRAGQTLITWQEVDPPVLKDAVPVRELLRVRRELEEQKKVYYRVYRSPEPIDSLDTLRPVAEVPPLTCWNADFYGDPHTDEPALRYVVEEGDPPVTPGTGIFCFNPQEAGQAWYAVTAVTDGRENQTLGTENRLRRPVRETVGPGEPVLQRIERPEQFNYVRGPTLHYFVRWESPPRCAQQGKPFDYVVAVPPEPAKPAPVGIHLHCWGGNLKQGYGWWYQAEQGHLLLASNQVPYDWWTGYHELYWRTPSDLSAAQRRRLWKDGVVRPYTQTRLLAFLDWMATRWEIDRSRTHVAGNSMGGSGAPMLAIRHPERIAWATGWVGVHIPALSPHFRGSYARVYGEPDWGVKFEDGTPVWDYFNDAWYLRRYPEKEVGLICFSNGKNDGGIGWAQAVEFLHALQQTRRPCVFVWGQAGHGQRARLPGSLSDRHMPLDLRIDQSLPAFAHCSLDDDPGDGEPSDGDAEGQVNLYLVWQTDEVVDQPDRWEMTMGLVDAAPRSECTVDLTPRRVQRFRLAPGMRVQWSNTPLAGGEESQTGEATADRLGLITLKGVRLTKGKNRIRVWR